MTALTSYELKVVYFGVLFLAICTLFASLYSANPIEQVAYTGESSVTAVSTETGASSWINSIIATLPAPFDDAQLAMVLAIFVSPVVFMLSYIALRALKDIITQWV